MLKHLSLYSFIGLTSWLISGCSKEEYTAPGLNANSVTGVIANDPTFSLFNAGLSKAELLQPLNDAGPFTVFAPTNAALQVAGITTTTIDTVAGLKGKTLLMSLLTYHMVGAANLQSVGNTDSSKTNFATLSANTSVSPPAPLQLFITQTSKGLVVNGATATATKPALNGVTFSVNKFLSIPTQTIAQVVSTNPDFSILAAAINSAGLQGDLERVTVGYGVFAPTNAAFIAKGITEANVATVPNLANILKYHLTPRVYFSANLESGSVRTLLGKTRTVAINAGPTVTLTDAIGETAAIPQADIVTINGVVHVIDKVLIPGL